MDVKVIMCLDSNRLLLAVADNSFYYYKLHENNDWKNIEAPDNDTILDVKCIDDKKIVVFTRPPDNPFLVHTYHGKFTGADELHIETSHRVFCHWQFSGISLL